MGKQNIILSELFDAVENPPKENGWYLVFSVFDGRVLGAMMLDYTVKYGWNTTEDGQNSSPIDYKKSNILHLWCKAKYEKGDKK